MGEPTGLEPCIAQRGLLILEAIWEGAAVHAGWAAELEARPASALDAAVRGLARLEGLELAPKDSVLGRTVATPTVMQAGSARNVTPERASVVLDVRTTPVADYDTLRRRLADAMGAEIRVISDRLRPARTPEGSRLLALLLEQRPDAVPFASPTSSDWVFLRDVDAIKLGPGDSRLSHTSREAMPLTEVEEGVRLYLDLARAFLA
ncbi:MAG: peptidase dimerization domain-containing protein [Acidobacteriota bacterium]|nr:peptidase dimerization domain-containing protein [Acidobacteriota bacterium]